MLVLKNFIAMCTKTHDYQKTLPEIFSYSYYKKEFILIFVKTHFKLHSYNLRTISKQYLGFLNIKHE